MRAEISYCDKVQRLNISQMDSTITNLISICIRLVLPNPTHKMLWSTTECSMM